MKPAKIPVRRQTKQPASATVEEQSAETEAEADQIPPPAKNAAPSSGGPAAGEGSEMVWETAIGTSVDVGVEAEEEEGPVRKKRKKKRKTVVKKWDPTMPLPTRREPDDPLPAPVTTKSGRLVKRTNFLNIG